MVKISVKDRQEQFLFLIGIFLVCMGLLGFGFFYDSGEQQKISKEVLMESLSQDMEFEETVKVQRATIDTAYKEIIVFDPNVRAAFLDNDIKNTLSSIKSNYDRKAFDLRYKSFLQVSTLYNMLFFNRRELKGNNNDLENLKKSLEDCKLSVRQLKETLGNQSRH